MSKQIIKKQAIDLLYAQNPNDSVRRTIVMDEFGNYIFPTDVIINKPNSVCGSSSGCESLSMIENSNKVQ